MTVTAPPVGGNSSVTTYDYSIDNLLNSVTNPEGRVTSFSYDLGGRNTKVTQPDPDGAGSLTAPFTDITYDGLGNVLKTSDALGHASSTSYDAWFRPLTTTDPLAQTTTRVYDAFSNLVSVTDPLSNVTSYDYNKLSQLVSENKSDGTTDHERTYSYDGVGNLRSMVDRNGRITEFDYDKLYRTTTETWKTGTTTNRTLGYTHDTSSRLTGVADSDSLATDFEFVYDDRSQLQLERQLTGFVGTSVIFDRDYDVVGNRTKLEANFGGTISDSSIVGGLFDFRNSYAYDAMHRLASVAQTQGSGANAVAPKLANFSYNAASQLTDLKRYSATSASSGALEVHSRMGYDQAGRLTSITHGKTEITAGQTWDGSSTLPASLGTTNTLAAYFLVYDQANRLTDFSSYWDAFKTTYTYDNRDQLTAASTAAISGLTPPFTVPTSESYNLDSNGNRKSGSTSQSASGSHNRLQTDGTYDYQYDGEGNVVLRSKTGVWEATSYAWDHRNRLVSVTTHPYYYYPNVYTSGGTNTPGDYQNYYSQRTEYVYDAFDQRVGKRTATYGWIGSETWSRSEAFVWADGQEVLRLVDSDGQGTNESFRVASRYLFGDAVDQVLADEQYDGNGPVVSSGSASSQTGETLWTLGDHLGSIRDVVDNSGVIRQHVVYDSFGNRVREVDYNSSGTQIAKSHADAIDELFGYTGSDWDEDVGLQYNRARWYDPATGRWLSQDPIGFAGGDANLYRYVGNHPTMSVDPNGLQEPQGQLIPPDQTVVPHRWPNAKPHSDPEYGFLYTGPRPELDSFGLPVELGHYSPYSFFKFSDIKPSETSYGCGGIVAMRLGLKPNAPHQLKLVEGAMAFGTLDDALRYLRDQLDGAGAVAVLQRNPINSQKIPFQTSDHRSLEGNFQVPANQVDTTPTCNFAILLGTPEDWYWEDGTGPWRTGGKFAITKET